MILRTDRSQFLGVGLVSLSAVLYGCIGFFGTEIIRADYTVSEMLFWRFLFATVWMLIFIGVSKKHKNPSRPRPYAIQLFFLAILAYSGSCAFYFLASTRVGTGIAMVIFFFYPLIIALFAYFFTNSRLSTHAWIALICVGIGLFLLNGQTQHAMDTIGLLYGLIAACSYGVYVFMGQWTSVLAPPKWQTLIITAGNTAFFYSLVLTQTSIHIPKDPWLFSCMVGIGIVGTAIPIQLLLEGLKYISPLKAGILSVFEPIVTVIMGVLLLKEAIQGSQFIGMIIILCGAILIQFEKEPQTLNSRQEDLT